LADAALALALVTITATGISDVISRPTESTTTVVVEPFVWILRSVVDETIPWFATNTGAPAFTTAIVDCWTETVVTFTTYVDVDVTC
jgi:hypothetical protein